MVFHNSIFRLALTFSLSCQLMLSFCFLTGVELFSYATSIEGLEGMYLSSIFALQDATPRRLRLGRLSFFIFLPLTLPVKVTEEFTAFFPDSPAGGGPHKRGMPGGNVPFPSSV